VSEVGGGVGGETGGGAPRFDGLYDCRGERLCSTCLRGAVEPFAIRVTVGLHSWVHEPGTDRAPLLPFALAGERRRLSPDRRTLRA
jgi:hypothetical protein